MAANDAGHLIQGLLKANDIEIPYADWSRVFPHWLLATVEDEVIGCVMILPAKPFGFVEFLVVKPTTSFKLRAIAIRKLCFQAAGTLKIYGSSALFCTVLKNNRKFADILEKHGMVTVDQCDLKMKRLI